MSSPKHTHAIASLLCSAVLAHGAQAQEAAPEIVPAPSPVCFAVTLHCFSGKAPVKPTEQPLRVAARLDLRAPAIAKVMPQSELQSVLPDPDEPKYDEPLVKVEGERGVPVNVPVGIMSLPWAVRHPTQFWRIFLPSPSRLSKDD